MSRRPADSDRRLASGIGHRNRRAGAKARMGVEWSLFGGTETKTEVDVEVEGERTMLEAFVERHLDKPWGWSRILLRNPSISWEFVVRHKERFERDHLQEYGRPLSPGVFIPPDDWDPDLHGPGFIDFREPDFKYIEKHPNKKWVLEQKWLFSYSRLVTPESVERQPDEGWRWGRAGLSDNPLITPEFVERHLDKPWDWWRLGCGKKPFLTLEFIERHLDKPWSWGREGLSRHPIITPEFVERHMDKPWHWGMFGLSSNPSITPEFIERHLDKPWSWGSWGLSCNPSITTEFVERHPNQGWEWSPFFGILLNPGLSQDFLRRYFERIPEGVGAGWLLDFGLAISKNPIVTPEFVEKHLDWPWVWGAPGLTENPSTTLEFIERHLDKPWDWGARGLSKNPAITLEFIERHLDKPWDWGQRALSINPVITPEFIERHLDKPWEWGDCWGLSSNTFKEEEKRQQRQTERLELRRVILKTEAIPTEMYAPISAFL